METILAIYYAALHHNKYQVSIWIYGWWAHLSDTGSPIQDSVQDTVHTSSTKNGNDTHDTHNKQITATFFFTLRMACWNQDHVIVIFRLKALLSVHLTYLILLLDICWLSLTYYLSAKDPMTVPKNMLDPNPTTKSSSMSCVLMP